AGAGFAYEHQVFLFWKLELCHTKPPFSKVFRRFRGSCVFIINAFVTKHQTKSLRIKVLNPALYSKNPRPGRGFLRYLLCGPHISTPGASILFFLRYFLLILWPPRMMAGRTMMGRFR